MLNFPHLSCSALVVTALLCPAPSLGAQGSAVPDSVPRGGAGLVTVGDVRDERSRVDQLVGASLDGHQFRSPSSMTAPLAGSASRLRFAVESPHVRLSYNSRLPYSLNDGALWSGRGLNLGLVGGAIMEFGRVRMILMPELSRSNNDAYALPDTGISLPPPPSRNPLSSPWHANSQSIDLPTRFGDAPLTRLSAGQSSITYDAGRLAVGAASENEWWGPGIRNALLLSNNAPGFPHLFIRTARPYDSPLGRVEGRWIAGGLTESAFFDYSTENDLRSIALLGVSLRPRGTSNVVIGASRSVFGAARNWREALGGFPQVFRDVGHPGAVPATDSTHPRGYDALLSLFARWRPASGVELYSEWARAEMPYNLRDFLVQPTHSQGYTLGLQWLALPISRLNGRVRVQAEATYVEQSTSFRFRNLGSWYTSHTVEQGYTERGQPLGAAIGPGASSQWLAVDHVAPRWMAGAYLTRVRWLQDVRSQKSFEGDSAYCSQDVSLLPGMRASGQTRFGNFGVDYSSGWRLNVFFEQRGICFEVPARDERNRSLTFTYAPPSRKRG